MRKIFAGLFFILFNVTINVNVLGWHFSVETMIIGFVFTALGFKEITGKGSFASRMTKFSWIMFLVFLVQFLVSFTELKESFGVILAVISVAGTGAFFIELIWGGQKAQIGINDSDGYRKVKLFGSIYLISFVIQNIGTLVIENSYVSGIEGIQRILSAAAVLGIILCIKIAMAICFIIYFRKVYCHTQVSYSI